MDRCRSLEAELGALFGGSPAPRRKPPKRAPRLSPEELQAKKDQAWAMKSLRGRIRGILIPLGWTPREREKVEGSFEIHADADWTRIEKIILWVPFGDRRGEEAVDSLSAHLLTSDPFIYAIDIWEDEGSVLWLEGGSS